MINKVSVKATPVAGTAETHIKVFITDILEALIAAHQAINDIENKYQVLLSKLDI